MRVQVSPGAFSQCVGIRNTRLTQNQLLKSVQVQVLSLRFDIFVHMAELADAHDLGSCAERRESSSLSMDIRYAASNHGCFLLQKIPALLLIKVMK